MFKSDSLIGILVVVLGVAGAAAGEFATRASRCVAEENQCCEEPARVFVIDSLAIRRDSLVIRIIGDVMLHRGQLEEALQEDSTYRFDTYLEGIRADLMSADLAVANMEFSLGGEPYTGYPAFSAPDSFADYVAGCGVDVFLMANNHIVDRDTLGLHRTLAYYDSLGISHTGLRAAADTLCAPLYIEAKGVRLAFVNFTYGTNLPNRSGEVRVNRMRRPEVLGSVAAARDSADLVVVLPHWGVEYELEHSEEQQSWARELAEAGADVIVGAHPHVVQDSCVVETADGRLVPVYYSVGNAVSNMSARYTQLELMVTLKVAVDDPKSLSVSHEWLWCTRPSTLGDSYRTIKIADCFGEPAIYPRSEWADSTAFDRMRYTYEAVRDSLYRR